MSCVHLAPFGPVLRSWFTHQFPVPTTAQQAAWPVLWRGHNLLLAAPTGQGKTLAAFLPILEELLRNSMSGLRCLYIAPLRALCNDVAERLEKHLTEIHRLCPDVPPLMVRMWTGDSSSAQRRRLRQEPPHIAVTTPESLALWLTHADGCAALADLRWIIVDEVHALAGTKRGADLSVTLERVSALAHARGLDGRRSPQRIGLSATCSPLEEVGHWLVGTERQVEIIAIPDRQSWALQIEHLPEEERFVTELMERLPSLLAQARSTLIFTNTRRLAERLTWLLRRRCPQWTSAIDVHHGSLAAACREEAEQGLQSGRLRVVVTSTSLELGVDIGPVEQVILVHPPGGVARLLQRLGRSGHTPGGVRRGILFTANTTELSEAVVTRAAGQLTQLEPLAIPHHPLDVLCQQLIGMGVQEYFTAALAWETVRRAYPFRDVSLADFAECLAYVTGKRRHVAVPGRLRRHEPFFTAADRTTVRVYRQNLGVIVPEPIRSVRHTEGHAVGQVNDAFADQLQPGDRFLLQGRSWEVKRLRLGEIEVAEVAGIPAQVRWEGGAWHWPQALAERIWWLRCRVKDALLEGTAAAAFMLQEEYGLEPVLGEHLAAWCQEQETVSEVPEGLGLLEACPLPEQDAQCYILHVPLGPAAAAGLAALLTWRLRHLGRVHTVVGTLGCGVIVPTAKELAPTQWRELLTAETASTELERLVADGPALAERFRGTAYTGLMLLKQPLGPRRRVGGRNWAGDRLLRWLRVVDPTFPLITQATREVLQEVYAVQDLLGWLRRVQEKPLRLRRLYEPSPFAAPWLPGAVPTIAPPLEDALRAVAQERRSVHAPHA